MRGNSHGTCVLVVDEMERADWKSGTNPKLTMEQHGLCFDLRYGPVLMGRPKWDGNYSESFVSRPLPRN